MREHDYLGEFELMILLAILRMGGRLCRENCRLCGREVSFGSVYALGRLELKGLVASRPGESASVRAGRASGTFT